jgi:hypothetical protein
LRLFFTPVWTMQIVASHAAERIRPEARGRNAC